MSIRALIFDFGNVVGFFDHSKATRRLKHYSRLPEEVIYQFLYNGSLEDDFEAGRIGVRDFLRALREGCGMTGDDREWGTAYADIFTPNSEVCALIPRLKARYRLVLGSNCTPLHSRRFREQFADTLRLFDGLVLSHEVRARKPHPAFYEACVRHAECPPDDCVFIDDMKVNVEGAQACGLQGIVYRRPEDLYTKMQELGITV